MRNESGRYFQKFISPLREESYLWKTTHLNTAERNEEVNKDWMKDGRKVRGRREKRKMRETVVECENEQQVPPPHTQAQTHQYLPIFQKKIKKVHFQHVFFCKEESVHLRSACWLLNAEALSFSCKSK